MEVCCNLASPINEVKMGIYLFPIRKLAHYGKTKFLICCIRCCISTLSHMVHGAVHARCGFSVHRDVAFLGIFVLKILTTISELVYLGGILTEPMALEILCFTTSGLIFNTSIP